MSYSYAFVARELRVPPTSRAVFHEYLRDHFLSQLIWESDACRQMYDVADPSCESFFTESEDAYAVVLIIRERFRVAYQLKQVHGVGVHVNWYVMFAM